MSDSKRSKRNDADETRSTRSRSDSTPSSTSKRKSSKRNEADRYGGVSRAPTDVSSTSQSRYPGTAAPSVVSSYATANTTDAPFQPADPVRNPIVNEQRAVPRSETGTESQKKRASDRTRDRSSDSDNTKARRRSKRSDKDDKKRSSKRDEKPRRTDSERALDNHRASMVENQFPGEFPSTFTEPYRPPGLAADYYGDQGQSVASQPGVRPLPPSIIIAADQAHLHEATIEAAPPPEPSSLGQLGAAASFYGGTSDFESDAPPKPSKNGKRSSLKAGQQSTGGASPRSSPGPGPVPYSGPGPGRVTMAGAGIGAAAGVGEAAEYFSTQFTPDLTEGGLNTVPSGYVAGPGVQMTPQGNQNTAQGVQNPAQGNTKPPFAAQGSSTGSNMPTYGAAAVGLAAAGAASYYAGHHTTEEHESMHNLAGGSYQTQNTGQVPFTSQTYQSQQPVQQRRRHRGPFSKIVDFFRDPIAVAEYEAYTEAIGVCKYCFDPGSTPRDAPRKHHYNRRYSDGRYGSSTRVDKLNRYTSSGDEKRRRSNDKKWVATGVAGYGLAKMSEAAANRRSEFCDDYSVKLGRPEGSSRVSYAADERVSESRRTKRTSGGDQNYSRQDSRHGSETKVRKDWRTGELYEERSSRRRRDSTSPDKFSKTTAISAGIAAAGLAAASSRRKRSKSPRKGHYSKRVSPNHSYVDLSVTNSGAIGFGSFFSSPSANQRKGKKQKGLGFFNFTNASSSSSDADLAFGAGSVRRKHRERYDRNGRDEGNVNAEILGLAATGVALAADEDRQDRRGKRRADLMVVKESRNDRTTRREKQRLQSTPVAFNEANEDWIDESDGESSVDSALAYGGGLSTRQSRESLGSNAGTDKWAWRWNNGKKPRRKPSQDLSRFAPAPAALADTASGAGASSSRRYASAESTVASQPLQQLDPIPMSDPNSIKIDRKTSAISPRTEILPSVPSINSSSAPLRHPQPVTPISQAVYSGQTSAPAPMYGTILPHVAPTYPPHAPMTESPKQLPAELEFQRPRADGERRKRRNSSPTPSHVRGDEFGDNSRSGASTRDSVKFDLTEEQREKDRRSQGRERRRSERKDSSDKKQAGSSNSQQEASLELERDEISSSRRSSTDARTAREIEIETELERLYEEDRRQREARKSKRSDTWPVVAAIGAGVTGAAIVAAAESTSVEKQSRTDIEESKPEREERRSRRKSALKQTTTPTTSNDDRSDSQQRRIARMAARRVKSTPSPVHEDYASYFIPPELAEKVNEHNYAAEHRDSPSEDPVQIVEVAPRTAGRKDTFDPFLYRPFGVQPDDDPTKFSWPVPFLELVEPTPPVSVRGDISPLPSRSPEPPEAAKEIPEKKQKRSSSVSWGEPRTHEYEVITPLEDHEEFVRTATYESSQPAIDLAERTHSDVKQELSEPVTVSVHTNGVPQSLAEKDMPEPKPVPKDSPPPKAKYPQDLEFAAVLAAATESAGFDPSIVVDDPTYHRRDSPPGSESTSFYQSPYTETVSDLGSSHNHAVPRRRRSPPTPADKVSTEDLGMARGKDSEIEVEGEEVGIDPKIPGGFSTFDNLDDSTIAATETGNHPGARGAANFGHGEAEEKHRNDENRSSEVHIPAAESIKSEPNDRELRTEREPSTTFDDITSATVPESSRPSVSDSRVPEGSETKMKSDEDSEKKSDFGVAAAIAGVAATATSVADGFMNPAQRGGVLQREDDDYHETSPISASDLGADISGDPKKTRKSDPESDTWDDTMSVTSSPAEMTDYRENGKRSKKNSKRDSNVSEDLNSDSGALRKSKEKKSTGGFFSLFSSGKSDKSASQKGSPIDMEVDSRNGKSSESEIVNEPKREGKRRSKAKVTDGAPSEMKRSRSNSLSSTKDKMRQRSPEDGFVSSQEVPRENERTEEGKSFLGERPEMPTVLDGASGSISKTQPEADQSNSDQPSTVLANTASSTVRSRSVSPRTVPATIEELKGAETEGLSPSTQRDQFRQQHLAEIRTSNIFSIPQATSSPTRVPLNFRRLPMSPGFARSVSVGSGWAGSPMSPLATPRTRQSRPNSTEFRNSKEVRPLYLVERHSSARPPEPEVEETYPPLPLSRMSSAHPSLENLRGDDQGESYAEAQMTMSQLRGRRHSSSYWRDERSTSPDYLDSGTATPTAAEFPKEVKRGKPKYEFHSPSELLEDPSGHGADPQEYQSPVLSPMILPSVGSPASSVAKNESGTASSMPSSPAQEQQAVDHKDMGAIIGLGLAGGDTAALALSDPVEHHDTATIPAEQSVPIKDAPKDEFHPSTIPGPPVNEDSTSTDVPISREIEVSAAPQAADPEFALRPMSGKKLKKGKREMRKTKTLDLGESVESGSFNTGERPDNVAPSGPSSLVEQLPLSEVDVRDMLSDLTTSEASFSPQPQPERSLFDAQVSTSTKSAEVEKPDVLADAHVDEQTVSEAVVEDKAPFLVGGMRDNCATEEQPTEESLKDDDWGFSTKKSKKEKKKKTKQKEATSVPLIVELEVVAPPLEETTDLGSQIMSTHESLLTPDKDLTVSQMPSLSLTEAGTGESSDKEAMRVVPVQVAQQDRARGLSFDSTLAAFDDTNEQGTLSEIASRESYPFDEPVEVPAPDIATPSGPSALEEAFAKAETARGTAPGVSEEEALEAFQPQASIDPSLGYERLDTILEVSREGSKVDLAQAEEASVNVSEDQAAPSRSLSKKEKKKDKKSKRSRGVEVFDSEPKDSTIGDVEDSTQMNNETTKDPMALTDPTGTVPISDPSINPFGDDYLLPREDDIGVQVLETSRDIAKADASHAEGAFAEASPPGALTQTVSAPEDPEELAEEFSLARISKKDKKKGKKGRTSALISDASAPMSETSSNESQDQFEAKQPVVESFVASTKKGKKNKRKGQALDWEEEDTTVKPGEGPPSSEEPVQKAAENERDLTLEENVDEFLTPGDNDANENKDKIQEANWTDETATPLPERLVNTPTETQPEVPLEEADTGNLTWTMTKKTKKDKKDKKKGKKSAVLSETPTENGNPRKDGPVVVPTTAEDQVSGLPDDSIVAVPQAIDDASLPRDDEPLQDEPSPRDIALLPEEVHLLPRDGTSLPHEKPSLPQADISLTPVDASLQQGESPPPQHHMQSTQRVEASQVSAPEVPDLLAAQVEDVKDPSAHQDTHKLSKPREILPQATGLSESIAPASVPGNHDVAAVSAPSHAPPQEVQGDDDHEASAPRASGWTSVFGELQQKIASQVGSTLRQTPLVDQSREASTLPDSRWASIFGELKQRKLPKSAKEDYQPTALSDATREVLAPVEEDNEKLSLPNIEQQSQVQSPTARENETDVLQAKAEPFVQQDPDPEGIREQAFEELLPDQVRPSAEHVPADEQVNDASLQSPVAQMTAAPFMVAEAVNEQTHEDVHDQMHAQASQEPDAESLSRVESKQQEAITPSNFENSEDGPEPELNSVAQSEAPIQAERGDGPETTADASHAPTKVAGALADLFSWAPTKKGKKDKKKSKNKQSTSEELAEPSTESSQSNDVPPTSIAADVAVAPGNEVSQVATPAEEPGTETEAFSWESGKKSKKDKKDKKKQKSLTVADDPSTTTGDDATTGWSSIPWPASLAYLTSVTPAEMSGVEETQVPKDVDADVHFQSQPEDISVSSKQVDESSLMHLMSKQPTPEDSQVTEDAGVEREIQSHMEDLSNLPSVEEGDLLKPTMAEQQQPTTERDEGVEANLEHDTTQAVKENGLVADPETVLEEPEDYSWTTTPRKKGKRDKKKKGPSLDASGSATPQTEDEPPLVENVVVPASVNIPETEPIGEDELVFTTKRGKKDKKSRRSTPQTSDSIAPKTEAEPAMAMNTVIPSASAQTEPAEEIEPTLLDPQSEKDEQENKNTLASSTSAAEPELEESEETRPMSQTVEPQAKGDDVERTEDDVSAASLAEREVEEKAVEPPASESTDAKGAESAIGRISTAAVSKLQAIIGSVGGFAIGEERKPDANIPEEQAMIDQGKGIESGTDREMVDAIPESQAVPDSAEAQPGIVNQFTHEDEPMVEQEPNTVTEEDSFWAPTPKQSKKDKKDKKKRKSTVALDELSADRSAAADARSLGDNETGMDSRAPADGTLFDGPDLADVETIAETTTPGPEMAVEAEPVPVTSNIIEPERNADENVSTEFEATDHSQQSGFPAVGEAETAPEDDAWAFPIKKGKKEKKAKRKAIIGPEEPSSEPVNATAEAIAASEPVQVDTVLSQANEPAENGLREAETAPIPSATTVGMSESSQRGDPVAEPEEDNWGFSTKRNKKDKKKKRQSTKDEYSSTPSAPATPAERAQAEEDMVVYPEGAANISTSEKHEGVEPEDSPFVADASPITEVTWSDFSSMGNKKSKKDKKKKKTLLSWGEENDVTPEQATETSTPANGPELGALGEQGPALDITEESTTAPKLEGLDLVLSEVLHLPALPETSTSTAQERMNITVDPVLDWTQSDSRDLASVQIADKAEDDGQADFPTVKKSKKSKKVRKGEAESAFVAIEDPSQGLELQEESWKPSYSAPGAFEDEPEAVPQLREVSETEDVKTEQNVPLAIGEPEMSAEVADIGDSMEYTTKSGRKGKKAKGRRSSRSRSTDTYPEEGLSERAVTEHDTRDRGLPDTAGLGIASAVVAQAAMSEANDVERSGQNEYAPLQQHDVQHAARQDDQHVAQYDDQHDVQYDAQHDDQHDIQHAAQYDVQHAAQHEANQDARYDNQHDIQHDVRDNDQHDVQHYAIHEQAMRDENAQQERDTSAFDHSQRLPIVPTVVEVMPLQSTWSFSNLKQDMIQEPTNRDSGIEVSESPLLQAGHLHPSARDSGYVPSPVAPASREVSTHEGDTLSSLTRPPRPISPTSSVEDLREKSHHQPMPSHQPETRREGGGRSMHATEDHGSDQDQFGHLARVHPSPVDSTTKDRSSALFNSSPSNRTDTYGATPMLDTRHIQSPTIDLHRSPSIHGPRSREDLRATTPSRSPTHHVQQTSHAPSADAWQEISSQPHRSIFGPFPTGNDHDRGLSPPRTPLQTIHEHIPDPSPLNRRRRQLSDVGSPDRGHKSVQRSSAPALGELDDRHDAEPTVDALHTPILTGHRDAVESARESQSTAAEDHSRARVEDSGLARLAGAAGVASEALISTSRDDRSGDAKSLGKSKSRSTSSKQLRRSQSSLENIASSSTHDPVREKGKGVARDMADIYNGYGESPGTPISPSRPPSVRSRRSIQQLKDLESRLDQLVSENRLLATAKINAEQQLQDLHFAQSQTEHALHEALELRDAELREKDEAIAKLREALDMVQREVAQLTEANEGLLATHEELRSTHEQRYSQLEERHASTQDQWQESSKELEDLRSKHAELSTGMEEIVRHELDTRLAQKDAEIQQLYEELEDAKTKIRALQQQILSGQSDDIIITRDEDYFDNACQQLCQHVQQWVLRFSKFSDTRVCRLTKEIRDEKVIDRFDNAILDGSDVDMYLGDRVRRRDVFMSVVMTMIWEYIFTRYLFGMDREQRQKLKLLEKNLSEVGPPSAVHRWRAMTLTLLSRRPIFEEQTANDTEAVVQEIYSTLARFLPPPQQLQNQIQESLRNVMKAAVDLSIEMRTQRAEYIMLPPLQPEYDTNGDLARKVYFNAALMNERSGETTSNEELESQQAVVRMVLFPLVVKKGSDAGEGDEEIVVCPAQVLVARSGKDKKVGRVVSGDRMSVDQGNRSVQSFTASVLDPTNVI